ncbi:MAG TPA: LLM class flavin-dependent oxidoreductase [Nitrososphaerales archaeon]|nr:LLM class flavin-dependent oxidoreductase [Nitrososphaerales archaeon]
MRFGISLAGMYDTPNYIEEALGYVQLLEMLGFDSVWTGDSQMLHRDAYCDLTLWSSRTERIHLGPCVTNPYTRHPSVTASAILTIDELSKGRALLGIGAGDSSVRRIGLQPRPISQLEETVKIVRELCEGRSVNFHGQQLKIRWGKPRKIPIYIAASGPKSLQTAGRVGDGAILHVGPSDDGIKFAVDHVREGVASAQRSNREKIDLAQFIFSSIDRSREKAIEDAKPFVTWYLVNIPEHPIIRAEKLAPDVSERIARYRKEYYQYDEDSSHHAPTWSSSVRESSFIPDELVEKYTVAGSPEDFVARLRHIESLGIDHVIFRPPYTEKFEESLELLGEVVQKFRW